MGERLSHRFTQVSFPNDKQIGSISLHVQGFGSLFFFVPGFDESERITKPEHFYAVFFLRKKIAKIT
jgi:hypothetical protein